MELQLTPSLSFPRNAGCPIPELGEIKSTNGLPLFAEMTMLVEGFPPPATCFVGNRVERVILRNALAIIGINFALSALHLQTGSLSVRLSAKGHMQTTSENFGLRFPTLEEIAVGEHGVGYECRESTYSRCSPDVWMRQHPETHCSFSNRFSDDPCKNRIRIPNIAGEHSSSQTAAYR
jgi:hypothetical protein